MFYMWWRTSVIQYKRIVNCLSLLFCCRDKDTDEKLLRGKREKDIRVAASALLLAGIWAEGRVSCPVEFLRVKIIGEISSPEIGVGGSSGIGGFSLPAIGGFLWQAGKVVRFCVLALVSWSWSWGQVRVRARVFSLWPFYHTEMIAGKYSEAQE